ncbi:hypothetical protein K402DRAFT_397383 [Aulographum hederae CBS 113979]|uniref:Uncharacterized protein n=1 Tax=Aulographum hederae CBS 113979 TaxID=1176131 RepID=A0A6G1GNX0_9PEZI|nr:hypothetical protein K402DRAFT_397383 [Aulographum hederae CBS 113979]
MAETRLFAGPSSRPSTLRSKRFTKRWKRATKKKHDFDDEDGAASEIGSDERADAGAHVDADSEIPEPSSSAQTAKQLEENGPGVGGNQEEPFPFPLPPAKKNPTYKYSTWEVPKQRIISGLGDGDQPLFEPPRPTSSLRRQHLQNIMTILHRCLAEGDYRRASRAWGMLLRAVVDYGRPFDVRGHGRWGIGAEILLRRNPPTNPLATGQRRRESDIASDEGSNASIPPNSSPQGPLALISEDGFKDAKDYYRVLITQHPFLANRKGSGFDATDFYPPLFNIWILEVVERSRVARAGLEQRLARQSTPADELDHDVSLSDHLPMNSPKSGDFREELEGIRNDERTKAEEIATELDEIIQKPPFDKDAELLHLRGMIALWIGDLSVPSSEGLDADERAELRLAISKGKEERKEQKQAAVSLFRRAGKLGGHSWVWKGYERLRESVKCDSDDEEEDSDDVALVDYETTLDLQ